MILMIIFKSIWISYNTDYPSAVLPLKNRSPSLNLHFACLWYDYMLISILPYIMVNDPLVYPPSIRRAVLPSETRNPSLSLRFACLWYGYIIISILLLIMVYDPLVIISTVLHIMANDPLLFLPSIRRVALPVANRNPPLSLRFACLWYGSMITPSTFLFGHWSSDPLLYLTSLWTPHRQ